MSLNTDLQTLKTNIEGVKSTLYTNLTNKGVTDITETDTLTTLADKVSTITVGGGGGAGSGIDFSSIGYDAELSAELNANMNADIAYSKTLLDAWNPSNTDAYALYRDDKNIVYAPNIDTSNVTSMREMFSRCYRLTRVPLFNTSSVTSMQNMFYYCSSLKKVPLFNTSNVTRMDYMFYYCSSLKKVPLFNTSNVTRMDYMFHNCASLTTVPAFDTSNVNNFNSMLQGCSSLTTIECISFKSFADSTMKNNYIVGITGNRSIRKAVFKDIGYQSTAVQFNTSKIEFWGVNEDDIPDARQSLIDSLITYSFDRLTAGYPTCTITLSDTTKALLTSDEISQINAKGFTIA